MSKNISTYIDLLEEISRLKVQLDVEKASLKENAREFKQHLLPFKSLWSFFSNFGSISRKNSLVTKGLGFSLELLFRKVFFRKAGWITKLIAPILLKNFSMNFLSKRKKPIFQAFKSFMHNKN